jgi:hypothetical protein
LWRHSRSLVIRPDPAGLGGVSARLSHPCRAKLDLPETAGTVPATGHDTPGTALRWLSALRLEGRRQGLGYHGEHIVGGDRLAVASDYDGGPADLAVVRDAARADLLGAEIRYSWAAQPTKSELAPTASSSIWA